MMNIRLRQHSVIVLLIGWAILSIGPGGSAFAQDQPQPRQAPIKPGVNFLLNEKAKDPATVEYQKAVDKEYQSKLKAIPDQPQKKVDPWGNVRSSTPK